MKGKRPNLIARTTDDLREAIFAIAPGERIGSLGTGRRPSFGKRAIDRLTTDLLRGTGRQFPAPPRAAATLIIASDFYDPIPEWSTRLAPLAAKCPEGVLLAVSAPVELDFPYVGRVKLSRPGAAIDRIIGRAETMRDDYQRRFAEQRDALEGLARRMGWGFATHVTGAPAIESAARLKAEIERFGAAR